MISAASIARVLICDLRESGSTSMSLIPAANALTLSRLPRVVANEMLSGQTSFCALPSQLACLAMNVRACHAHIVAEPSCINGSVRFDAHVASKHLSLVFLFLIISCNISIVVIHRD